MSLCLCADGQVWRARDEGRMGGSDCPSERHDEASCPVGDLGWWRSCGPKTLTKGPQALCVSGMSPRLSSDKSIPNFKSASGSSSRQDPDFFFFEILEGRTSSVWLSVGCSNTLRSSGRTRLKRLAEEGQTKLPLGAHLRELRPLPTALLSCALVAWGLGRQDPEILHRRSALETFTSLVS